MPPQVAKPVASGIGSALAVAGQMGADGKAVVAASRQAFVDGMTPALYLGAAVALAAAIFTALRGPKTAAEAELATAFGHSTIERWFHAARKERRDPLAALSRKVRSDRGQPTAIGPALAARLVAQYAAHRGWTVQLHHDNLAALVRAEPALGPMPSYPTLRRHLLAQGMARVRRGPGGHRPGALAAQDRRDRVEQRSYEVAHVGALWHADFHDGRRLVLLPDGRRVLPQLFAVIDDHSRLVCHAQWYLDEDTEALVHGVSQAILKRGLPRALLTDNGAAMVAAETTEGLARLGIVHHTTLPYSPEQNAKQEVFWAQIEGRLVPMLEGEAALTLRIMDDGAGLPADYAAGVGFISMRDLLQVEIEERNQEIKLMNEYLHSTPSVVWQ